MNRYIAFIRGINAGLRIKMPDLRHLFETLSFTDIKTVLATGNVIFETSETNKGKIAHQIEQAIETTHNYPTVVVVYTKPELEQVISDDPFRNVTPALHQTPHVSFTKKGSGKLPFTLPHDVPEKGYKILQSTDEAVFSLIDLSGATRPDLLVVLDRAFSKQVTTRNWKTVERCFQAME